MLCRYDSKYLRHFEAGVGSSFIASLNGRELLANFLAKLGSTNEAKLSI
jgi:hypothetical protein